MQVSIVILNYNGREHLEQFLPSVVAFSGDHHIVVADNCSTDDSIEFLESNYPDVQIIKNSMNGGYSWGYNQALQQIDSEYFILLNSDVEVTENWIHPIIGMMESNANIGAAQPKILSYSNKDEFEYAGAAGGYLDKYGYPFCKGRLFQSLEKDNGQYDDSYPIFWASGACLFIRSKVFHELGGFDNDFFAHMEEIDLCWRIHNAGYVIKYYGKAKVYHVGGGTLHKSNPRKTYLNFRNGLSLLVKNYNIGDLMLKLPVRILFDMVATAKFLLFDSFRDGLAVIKAHFHFWAMLPKNLGKRRTIKLKRKKTKEFSTIYQESVVIAHYARKAKTFNDLRL